MLWFSEGYKNQEKLSEEEKDVSENEKRSVGRNKRSVGSKSLKSKITETGIR